MPHSKKLEQKHKISNSNMKFAKVNYLLILGCIYHAEQAKAKGIRRGKELKAEPNESTFIEDFENNLQNEFASSIVTAFTNTKDEVINELQSKKADKSSGKGIDARMKSLESSLTLAEVNSLKASLDEFEQREEEEESYCPAVRYRQWSSQPIKFKWLGLALTLGLFRRTWDYITPTNRFESEGWYAKSSTQMLVLNMMGYDEDKFDCCNNHYEDYDWVDFTTDYGNGMEYEEQIEALRALGYSKQAWDTGVGVPAEFMAWSELTQNQRDLAASKLCWTELLWDQELPLPTWGEDAVLPDAW